MIPGAGAVAEGPAPAAARCSLAIVVAYEMYCGLCEAALAERRLDQATAAAVGTAAGAANLLGLDEARTANALSLALSANLALYNVRCGTLSDWKGCAGPNGARNGLFAALLARDGVTGPTAPVEGKGGLFDWSRARSIWQAGASARPHADGHAPQAPPGVLSRPDRDRCGAGTARRGAAGGHRRRSRSRPTRRHSRRWARWAPAATAAATPSAGRRPRARPADHSQPYTIAMALLQGSVPVR
jgi:2-methylcitrate dehydratase